METRRRGGRRRVWYASVVATTPSSRPDVYQIFVSAWKLDVDHGVISLSSKHGSSSATLTSSWLAVRTMNGIAGVPVIRSMRQRRLHSRDVRQWLLTCPFPPIPIPNSVFYSHSRAHLYFTDSDCHRKRSIMSMPSIYDVVLLIMSSPSQAGVGCHAARQ